MNIKLSKKCTGLGLIGWIILIPFIFIGLIILIFIGCEINKAYWDHKVKEMCEEDGGIKVYERVPVPERYVDKDGLIRIPTLSRDPTRKPFGWEAKPDDLFYRIVDYKHIVEGFLSVRRSSIKLIRSTDKKVLGESVSYGRGGGDFPTGLFHGSSYICPEHLNLEEAIFLRSQSANL